ncbi:MAG: hypothetical protein QM760_09115 [Nibricoccus sp.]
MTALCLGAAFIGAVLGWLSIHSWSFSRSDVRSASIAASAPGSTSGNSELAISDATSASPSSPWADRWEETLSLTSNPARTRALAALLEELARTDPQRALSLAQNQPDWRLRDILRDASLRGWATVAPEAAGDWALGVRIEDRRAVVGAVLQGAAVHPDATVSLALRLCSADPAPAGDYGHAAIAALVNAGAFSHAADFGAAMGSEKYSFLFKSAYFEWARQRPAEALAAAEKITNPQLAAQARSQAITGWSWADASGLANHALTLPAGPERSQALAEALPLWLERYPEEAADWIQKNDTGSEFDTGLAAIANQQSLLKSSPTAAINLASDISDPSKRTETMRSVFQQWAARDPQAARAYLDHSASAADRAALSAVFADVFPDGTR